MNIAEGLLMGFIGCTVTFIGFFIAFLCINHNKKKQLKKSKKPDNALTRYWGDDTV